MHPRNTRETLTTALVGKPAGVRSEGSWSSTAPVEGQLKAAGARQHLSEDTDVDQCHVPKNTDIFQPLPTGRLSAQFLVEV